jgi:aryl-alcohol dehydrogenase-like predicted oxidoreductase
MLLKQRVLGKSEIAVTEIGLGLWAAGGESWGATDDAEVLRAIDVALSHGVNCRKAG